MLVIVTVCFIFNIFYLSFLPLEQVYGVINRGLLFRMGSEFGANQLTNTSLTILGKLDAHGKNGEIQNLIISPGLNLSKRPVLSSYSIDLLNEDGEVQARFPFNIKAENYTNRSVSLIKETTPFIQGTHQVIISKDDEIIIRKNITVIPEVQNVQKVK